MSVKGMTSAQIRADLSAIALIWPDGVPWEQTDRVNALKGELKRRGEDFVVTAASSPRVTVPPTASRSDEELETELRDLSVSIAKNPKDEEAQKRFADVRYELRQRSKSSAQLPADPDIPLTKVTAPMPARSLEMPEDDAPPQKIASVGTPLEESSDRAEPQRIIKMSATQRSDTAIVAAAGDGVVATSAGRPIGAVLIPGVPGATVWIEMSPNVTVCKRLTSRELASFINDASNLLPLTRI